MLSLPAAYGGASQVHRLQKELEALQPVLAKSQRDTADLMEVIQKRLPGVEETRAVVKVRYLEVRNAATVGVCVPADCLWWLL